MKFKLIYLLCVLLFLNCENEEKLVIEPMTFSSKACDDCAKVDINIPKVLGNSKIGRTVEKTLQEELIFLLTFDEEIEVGTIEEAIESFQNGYMNLREIYPDENTLWEADVDGKIVFEDKNLLSLHLDSYVFTGGAHGYKSIRFLNFDKKKGIELENWQLFKNAPEFEKFAEDKFRAQEKIPKDRPINSTGFMFEKNRFYLPENIGFTEDGLQLLYNQYEVASYADGPIELTLPYGEINKFLGEKINL